jgi:hypothetical protein
MIEYLITVHEFQKVHPMMRRAKEEVPAGRGPLENHGSAGGESHHRGASATEDRGDRNSRCAG